MAGNVHKGDRLGTMRLRHEHTNEIIKIPTPSNDPQDPLNWPQWYKYFVAGISSWAILMSTFCASGPAVILPNMAITFFGPPGPHFAAAISKASYFITVCALMMGVSNLVWVPLMIKFGRRWVYILAYALYCGTAAWCATAESYSSLLAARAILGCAAGAGEVLGPLTIADIFFVHERGAMMVIYTCMLSAGTSLGALVAGFITVNHSWRTFFWLSCALTGATCVMIFFFFPETTYQRSSLNPPPDVVGPGPEKTSSEEAEYADDETSQASIVVGSRPSFSKILATWPTKSFTSEPLWKLSLRPIVLIVLPSALWASLVMSVSIGFLIAMASNISTAFSSTYHFTTWQIGLSMIAGLVGSVVAIWFGGPLSDIIADHLTRLNGGLREPEMRLPAMAISLVTGPLALVLYGVGIGNELHWICPIIGFALTGEVTMTQYTFKCNVKSLMMVFTSSLFGFLLSFYTNVWIQEQGYQQAFGEMAIISGVIFLGLFIFYFFGGFLRRWSWEWSIMKLVHWEGDREVGE
ncbi:MFS transporter [Penicillium diatomitis]|uniref:MFS transporter n=1 Tax=Penicillium diatomitis TaxID=2819901 RepID=A0A9X0C1T5_9EURO|nr:MFS transporter [Penicillium diatomitis]KAJ5494933.1 MFS transporter [Penicillium diatomitis]